MRFKKQPIDPKSETARTVLALENNHADTISAITYTDAYQKWQWYQSNRPFFNVYPTILNCLLRTKIEIDPACIPKSVLHELQCIEVRVPQDSNLVSFLLGLYQQGAIVTHQNETQQKLLARMNYGEKISIDGGTTYSEDGKDLGNIEIIEKDALLNSVRLAIGVMLLANDPDYCKPVLLQKDLPRIRTEIDYQKAVDRARRRGVVGFDIGKDLESQSVGPHFRRPHFGIRWTGKGSSVPKLVPIKGAVINKEKMTEVPTGYDG